MAINLTDAEDPAGADYDSANPKIVYDIYSGITGSFIDKMIVFNNCLYFTANDGVSGYELWSHDGTDPAALNTNIKRETDINTAGDSFETSLRAYFPVVYNNKLIFSANDGVTGLELWEYDGINQPTMLPEINTSGDIADGEVSSSEKVILNDKVYFAADDGVNGSELWVYFEK